MIDSFLCSFSTEDHLALAIVYLKICELEHAGEVLFNLPKVSELRLKYNVSSLEFSKSKINNHGNHKIDIYFPCRKK